MCQEDGMRCKIWPWPCLPATPSSIVGVLPSRIFQNELQIRVSFSTFEPVQRMYEKMVVHMKPKGWPWFYLVPIKNIRKYQKDMKIHHWPVKTVKNATLKHSPKVIKTQSKNGPKDPYSKRSKYVIFCNYWHQIILQPTSALYCTSAVPQKLLGHYLKLQESRGTKLQEPRDAKKKKSVINTLKKNYKG